METIEKLDKIDLQILRILQENARLTTKELASRVSLSSTPVFERLKRLEREGYIKKYIAVLDATKLNQGFIVFCSVKLSRLNKEIAERLCISVHTVITHRRNIARKLKIRSLAGLTLYAIANNLIDRSIIFG